MIPEKIYNSLIHDNEISELRDIMRIAMKS